MKTPEFKIAFVPIDNRPITYLLTEQITSINNNLKLFMPKRELLGGLVDVSSIDAILDWLKNLEAVNLIVLSLDTIAYGGLVSSRRCTETYDEIKSRILKLKEILKIKKKENPNLKIYATSSIMRISNNNINEEEKEYWNKWGKRIFSYSYYQHKSRVLKEYNCVYNIIPNEILEDYLDTRKRNFDINKFYLELLKEEIFNYLVFSKDDTGEFGLNVEEANILDELIKKENLPAIIKTGADEIPLGLLLRGILDDKKVKIDVIYSHPESKNLISRYEDISIEKCVLAQINLGVKNAEITNINPDVTLFVNNFQNLQGELVFLDSINEFKGELPKFETPYIIADVSNANGADNGLIKEILKQDLSENFLSYSGYNTSANTIGSTLIIGLISYFAKKEGVFDEAAHKKLLITRLLDDWGYQANVRKIIQKREDKNFIDALELNKDKFKPFEDEIKNFTKEDFNVEYLLPWKRSFEIEIEVNYGNKI